MLEMDLLVASEINERVKEATDEASKKGKAKGMAARLQQRRKKQRTGPDGQLLNDADYMLEAIREAGMPIKEVSNSSSDGENE